ncbi:MAG TPA: hypothetical protein VGN20_10340 [Mucilaginibacter sp.]|jgi:hypothetical protein
MSNKFFEPGEQSPIKDSSSTVQLSAEMFFGDNGHAGYFTRKQFLNYGSSLREKEAHDLNTGLDAMKNGLTMGGSLVQRPDRSGRPYIHPEFFKPRGRLGVKIILEHGIEGFISDYQNGYIRPMFTLQDLIEEAKKEE